MHTVIDNVKALLQLPACRGGIWEVTDFKNRLSLKKDEGIFK